MSEECEALKFIRINTKRKYMKYAVEARVFSNGMVVSKVRPAVDGEENSTNQTMTCEIWIDVFDTEQEAREFAKGYRKA